MAITDAYCSEPEYRAAKKQESSADALINAQYLSAASRYIDFKLDRKSGFNKDATGSETFRVYEVRAGSPSRSDWAESENPWKYGGMKRVIDVDDLVSVTSITVDENRTGTFSTTLSTNDYELLPLNAAKGAEVKPYTQIGMTSWGAYTAWGNGWRVKVTGVHGWPAVPEAIKVATIEIAAILQLKSPYATGRIEDYDQVVGTSPQARAILMGLMTNYGKGLYF